jgi:hypothetical protein
MRNNKYSLILLLLLVSCTKIQLKQYSHQASISGDYFKNYAQTIKRLHECHRFILDDEAKSELTADSVYQLSYGLVYGAFIPSPGHIYNYVYFRNYKSIKEGEVVLKRDHKSQIEILFKQVTNNKTQVTISASYPKDLQLISEDELLKVVTVANYECPNK